MDTKIVKDLEKRLWDTADELRANTIYNLGEIYEYFLGNFALAEGQDGGILYSQDSSAIYGIGIEANRG